MSILTKYLLSKYLKYFIIILISLELFFVGIDYLQNYKAIPNSANLQVLYILYNSFFTLTLTLPLSLVFAWVLTLVVIIKSNELVAFYSVGAQEKFIYKPILKVSIFLIFILVVLQATPLAYSYEQKSKIKDGEYFSNTKEDIFLKYNDKFVFFKKLFPLEKKAEGIHIYKLKNNDITETIVAKKAYFQNNRWYIVDAKITKKPIVMNFENAKLIITHEKFLHTLEGFKPKILDNVYEKKSKFSILDAFSALVLLSSQEVNTYKIRASLYYELITSFFILPILLLVFTYAQANGRTFSVGAFSSFAIFGTLVIWGIFFMLNRLSLGGVLLPEFSILLPSIFWYIFGYYLFLKKQEI